jgi:NAD(P)-dependent dehydrogenase (short-subunit alcohol dehydrogenase family)
MAEDFAGKVAVVTGGGNGIGAAACRAFAAQGGRVAVLDRDAAAAQRVAGGIADRGADASAHAIDVADRAAFNAAATEIAEAAGGIDILVNGAGTTVRRLIPEMSPEDWDRVIAVNLTGAFNGIRAVLPYMRRRGGGAIVNVASIAGQRISFGGTANYSASKAGLLGLTRHAGLRARARRHPRQRRLPGSDGHRIRRGNSLGGSQSDARAKNPAGPHVRTGGHRRPDLVPRRSCGAHDHRGRIDRGWRRTGQE